MTTPKLNVVTMLPLHDDIHVCLRGQSVRSTYLSLGIRYMQSHEQMLRAETQEKKRRDAQAKSLMPPSTNLLRMKCRVASKHTGTM